MRSLVLPLATATAVTLAAPGCFWLPQQDDDPSYAGSPGTTGHAGTTGHTGTEGHGGTAGHRGSAGRAGHPGEGGTAGHEGSSGTTGTSRRPQAGSSTSPASPAEPDGPQSAAGPSSAAGAGSGGASGSAGVSASGSASASTGSEHYSLRLKNNCPQPVHLFVGDKPKFGSGTYTSIGANTVRSLSGLAPETIWIVDDARNGVASYTASAGSQRVEITEGCTGLAAQ